MRPAYRNPLILLLALAALGGCVPPAPRAPAAAGGLCLPSRDQVLDQDGMLRYFRCLRSLPPADAAKEYDAVRQHLAQTASGADRVKLALLLALPDTPFHSTASALQLLGPTPDPHAGVPPELRDLAQFLTTSLAQQQALDDKARNLEKDLAAEKQRSDALQAKIDSVKDLERTMIRKDGR